MFRQRATWPNGHDKNWVRLSGAIDGFFVRYGHWPTRVRIDAACFADLRDHLFTGKAWLKLQKRITLIASDNAPFIAEDESGESYSYGASGFPEQSPTPSAEEWLGVTPDRTH